MTEDLGCIESLELPSDWEASTDSSSFGGRAVKRFHPVGLTEVRFVVYLREVTLSRPSQEAFENVIYSEFHALTQDELDGLGEVLEGMSNSQAFHLASAITTYLCGKRVLKIHGRWLKSMEETLSCFVDVRGDGKIVQQIYFIAPFDLFEKYSAQVDKIFTSIKWKLATIPE